MGIVRGINIVQDDLVFGFDTGHGIADNATSTRFYPGEPTTNLYTNSDFNGEVGWTFGSWNNNAVTHTSVSNVIGRDGRTCKAEKLYIGASSSASHFHQYNQGKYTSGNTYTTSAWVKGSGTFAIKSHWGGNTNFTMTGEWQRVSMTVTATSSSSSHFPYFAGEGLTVGSDFYITDAQTELKSHATPYVYSGGNSTSRSNTASLIDLKRTRSINTSGASFDSTGQPFFDGTDDVISLGTNFDLNNKSFSVEAIIKWDGGSEDTFFSYKDSAGGTQKDIHWRIYTSGQLRFDFYSNSINSSTGSIVADEYVHLVTTYDSVSDSCICYKNGEVLMSGSAGPFLGNDANSTAYVGAWGTTQRFGGEIPILKMYNSAISASEIKQNFNAYKNRFNI